MTLVTVNAFVTDVTGSGDNAPKCPGFNILCRDFFRSPKLSLLFVPIMVSGVLINIDSDFILRTSVGSPRCIDREQDTENRLSMGVPIL